VWVAGKTDPSLTRTIPERFIEMSHHNIALYKTGLRFILLYITLLTHSNNLRQVVYTYVPLSPSSITWYRPKGGEALRMGR